jgi:hypothetical protein
MALNKRYNKKDIEQICLKEIAEKSFTLADFDKELPALVPMVVGHLQEALMEKSISPRDAAEALRAVGDFLFKQEQSRLTKIKLLLEYKEEPEEVRQVLDLVQNSAPQTDDEKKESQKVAEKLLAIGATTLYAVESPRPL